MSEIISIPILELMEKTEQWLLNQGYKKNTLGVYKATWNKFRAYSSSPFYDRETAEKFLLRYFGVDANAIDQKLDKAMHLLRAGVNMIYIRDFLGHVDISTTEVYARIDAEMKRKVFEEKVPNFTPNTTMPWEEDKDLLQWLTKFGKKSF